MSSPQHLCDLLADLPHSGHPKSPLRAIVFPQHKSCEFDCLPHLEQPNLDKFFTSHCVKKTN